MKKAKKEPITPVVQAAQIAADAMSTAAQSAKQVVMDAADASSQADDRTTRMLEDALRQVFGEHEDTQRFVDVTRIPLLCKSVIDINLRLMGIETQLKPILWGVGLIAGAIILAIIGALFKLIIIK